MFEGFSVSGGLIVYFLVECLDLIIEGIAECGIIFSFPLHVLRLLGTEHSVFCACML